MQKIFVVAENLRKVVPATDVADGLFDFHTVLRRQQREQAVILAAHAVNLGIVDLGKRAPEGD